MAVRVVMVLIRRPNVYSSLRRIFSESENQGCGVHASYPRLCFTVIYHRGIFRGSGGEKKKNGRAIFIYSIEFLWKRELFLFFCFVYWKSCAWKKFTRGVVEKWKRPPPFLFIAVHFTPKAWEVKNITKGLLVLTKKCPAALVYLKKVRYRKIKTVRILGQSALSQLANEPTFRGGGGIKRSFRDAIKES